MSTSVTAAAADSGGLTQLAGAAGCIENASGFMDLTCSTGHALQEVSAVVVSPDGKNAYSVSTNTPSGVESFRRDPGTGALTQLAGVDGCTTVDGTDETGTAGACRAGVGLNAARFVLIAPDGKNVYVASGNSQAIAIFNRDPATGALSQPAGTAGCLGDGTDPACATGARRLGDVRDTTISPDGRFIYASGASGDMVSVMARDTSTGALSQVAGAIGCINASGDNGSGAGTCTVARALFEPTSVAITSDGRFMYVTASGALGPSNGDGAVISFSRDPTTGAVTQLSGVRGCLNTTGDDGSGAGTCTVGKALHDANSVVVSPDGTSVYVAAQGDGGVNTPGALDTFARDTTTGAITQLAGTAGCISLNGTDGFNAGTGVCAAGRGLDEVSSVAVSGDGRSVYTASSDTNPNSFPPGAAAVAAFSRDSASGALAQLSGTAGCISDSLGTDSVGGTTCALGRGISGPNIIALSPDCSSVYAANQDDPASLTAFSRAPACAGPVVTLGAVSALTSTSATLGGTVNSVNGPATAHFEFGRTAGYGSSTAATTIPDDATAHAASSAITGLTPAAVYHARLVASNAFGTTVSGDETFTTATTPPPAKSLVARIVRVRATRATVRVTISCQGPKPESCTGALRVAVRVRAKHQRRLQTVTIGRAKAKVLAGSSKTLSITISSRGRSLRRQQTLKAKVTLTVPAARHQRKATKTKNVTLKRVRSRR